MTTLKQVKEIKNWKIVGDAEAVGDLAGKTHVEEVFTIQSGRNVAIRAWIDPDTGDGWEERTYLLMEGEA